MQWKMIEPNEDTASWVGSSVAAQALVRMTDERFAGRLRLGEFARRWGVSKQRASVWAMDGRLGDALAVVNYRVWIRADAPRPVEAKPVGVRHEMPLMRVPVPEDFSWRGRTLDWAGARVYLRELMLFAPETMQGLRIKAFATLGHDGVRPRAGSVDNGIG